MGGGGVVQKEANEKMKHRSKVYIYFINKIKS